MVAGRGGYIILLAAQLCLASPVLAEQSAQVRASSHGADAESSAGLKQLMLDILAAKRAGNHRAAEKLIGGLVLSDPKPWMVANFGESLGKRLAERHKEERKRLPKLLAAAFQILVEEDLMQVEIRVREVPIARQNTQHAPPDRATVDPQPVLLYIVYFFSEGSQMVKSLSYFAYVKEAFRFIGPLEPASPEGAKLLKLEKNSPGKAVEEVLRRFAREAERPLDALSPPGQAPGPQKAGEGTDPVEILTPTHGVDFTHYLNRSRSKVRRNWQAAIPESARLGAKGKVVVQFRILRDGTVSPVDVTLVISSGNDPMDRAAIQSILASSPLEPLPTAFPGAHVEVRFIFLYNLPLPSTTAQPPAP